MTAKKTKSGYRKDTGGCRAGIGTFIQALAYPDTCLHLEWTFIEAILQRMRGNILRTAGLIQDDDALLLLMF
jgi:hypothetical protein